MKDSEFYKKIWDERDHHCEECGVYLRDYAPHYISHILSRGAHPRLRHNPGNVNILCFSCHQMWEFGDKESMEIFIKNNRIMEQLKKEYYEERRDYSNGIYH